MLSEQALLAKLTRRLIPFMFLLYIVSYLDRINVGFAQLQMSGALKFDPAVFGFGAGIFFVGYFVFEVPSNLIMARLGARIWIARILVTWGVISSSMMLVNGPYTFYALRFLLGVAEAGFFPGMILYLTYWFPAEVRGRTVARFMTATALGGVIGGPLSGALLKMSGIAGLAGWQWLFLLEGIPAVILGFVTLVYLPDGPKAARWLSSEEKQWIETRLETERRAALQLPHGRHSLHDAIASGRVWTCAAIYFGIIMSFYGVAFWLPQIVRSFSGLSDFFVGVVSALPYVVATVAMVLLGRNSDRTGDRRWHVTLSALAGGIGLIAAAFIQTPVLELAALALAAAGIWGTLGPFWALSSEFLTGAGAAAGIALINSVGNLGGFVGPNVVGQIKLYTNSFTFPLLALALFLMAAASTVALSVRKPTGQ
jgi:MFS family permease